MVSMIRISCSITTIIKLLSYIPVNITAIQVLIFSMPGYLLAVPYGPGTLKYISDHLILIIMDTTMTRPLIMLFCILLLKTIKGFSMQKERRCLLQNWCLIQ